MLRWCEMIELNDQVSLTMLRVSRPTLLISKFSYLNFSHQLNWTIGMIFSYEVHSYAYCEIWEREWETGCWDHSLLNIICLAFSFYILKLLDCIGLVRGVDDDKKNEKMKQIIIKKISKIKMIMENVVE